MSGSFIKIPNQLIRIALTENEYGLLTYIFLNRYSNKYSNEIVINVNMLEQYFYSTNDKRSVDVNKILNALNLFMNGYQVKQDRLFENWLHVYSFLDNKEIKTIDQLQNISINKLFLCSMVDNAQIANGFTILLISEYDKLRQFYMSYYLNKKRKLNFAKLLTIYCYVKKEFQYNQNLNKFKPLSLDTITEKVRMPITSFKTYINFLKKADSLKIISKNKKNYIISC